MMGWLVWNLFCLTGSEIDQTEELARESKWRMMQRFGLKGLSDSRQQRLSYDQQHPYCQDRSHCYWGIRTAVDKVVRQ
jgi:hypothetical protein